MPYNPDIHHRQSIRLKQYDYSSAGAYFVTICSYNRECIFGNIVNSNMELSSIGKIVEQEWHEIPKRFPDVELDAFVIMPNHIHGIIVILNDNCRGCRGEVSSPALKTDETKSPQKGGVTPPLQKRTLGRIIAYFKYQSAKHINQIQNTPGISIWQRNFYEHIIRNDADLNKIRQYIIDNPLRWEVDEENPKKEERYRTGSIKSRS